MAVDLFEVPCAQINSVNERKKNCFEVIVGPFNRSFGHAVGNAIRRILLSSIPGFSVVRLACCRL